MAGAVASRGLRDRLAVLASTPQYEHHLLPVWLALPAAHRGPFLVMDDAAAVRVRIRARADIEDPIVRRWDGESDLPVLVGSASDLGRVRRARAGRIAYMEHGCGQSYPGDRRTARHSAYAGGDGREGVGIILAPNAIAARRWAERYPGTPVHIIGATRVLTPPEDPGRPTLALSWHWTGPIPEQRNALSWYAGILPRLRTSFRVIGHAHPRFARSAMSAFARAGIPFVQEIDDVARMATVYAVDNSSTLWEMGIHRPVIALNAPWYRRAVHHGLRFWTHIPAMVDDGAALLSLAGRLLNGGETVDEWIRREEIIEEVIPHRDGAERAATLLVAWAAEGIG